MIHLVTALRCEAEPLIEELCLRPSSRESGAPRGGVFVGEEARLVIGGVGRRAAARATERLYAAAPDVSAVWLEVGVAAHRHRPIGQAVVAHKIVEEATGRTWYPPLVAELALPTATVCTVDAPVLEPAGERIYEMEASGFFAAALRYVTAELAGCVKVISDHGVSEPRSLDADRVREIVAGRVEVIVDHARRLGTLLERLPAAPASEHEAEITERWHFTVTQKRQLRRLLVRAGTLGADPQGLLPAAAQSSRQVLSTIGTRLDELAIESLPPGLGRRRAGAGEAR